MVELKNKPKQECQVYKEDQEWPGFYGAIWKDGIGREVHLMMLKLDVVRDEGYPFVWVKKDLSFHAIGTYAEVGKCLNISSLGAVFKFDSFSELTKWMEQ